MLNSTKKFGKKNGVMLGTQLNVNLQNCVETFIEIAFFCWFTIVCFVAADKMVNFSNLIWNFLLHLHTVHKSSYQ